jgi:hypothetical protein
MEHRHLLTAGLLALAAVGSAHAADVTLTPNGVWYEFFVIDPAFNLGNTDLSWVDINDYSKISFGFTGAAGFHATVTVVDGAFSGDYDAALSNADFSRGVYGFGAGSYTVAGALFTSALDGDGAALNATVGALKLEIAPVPEGSTLAVLLAGLGVFGRLARRRAV